MGMLYQTAKYLIARAVDLEMLTWRHHGLGMLQAELHDAPNLRVHVWHPDLVRLPAGVRRVHDHRFDITSVVLHGSVHDMHWSVVPNPTLEERGRTDWVQTKVWEIQHAKAQGQPGTGGARGGCSTATDVSLVGPAWARFSAGEVKYAGNAYTIQRRIFHTTVVEDLAITLIERSNFDERLARVLGDNLDTEPQSAIQRDTPPEIIERYVQRAIRALS